MGRGSGTASNGQAFVAVRLAPVTDREEQVTLLVQAHRTVDRLDKATNAQMRRALESINRVALGLGLAPNFAFGYWGSRPELAFEVPGSDQCVQFDVAKDGPGPPLLLVLEAFAEEQGAVRR